MTDYDDDVRVKIPIVGDETVRLTRIYRMDNNRRAGALQLS